MRLSACLFFQWICFFLFGIILVSCGQKEIAIDKAEITKIINEDPDIYDDPSEIVNPKKKTDSKLDKGLLEKKKYQVIGECIVKTEPRDTGRKVGKIRAGKKIWADQAIWDGKPVAEWAQIKTRRSYAYILKECIGH